MNPMHEISYFLTATGEITGWTSIREGEEELGLHADKSWLPGRHDADVSRIDPETGEVVPLHEFETPDAVTATIENLPEGTKAIIRGEGVIVNDGHLTIAGSEGFEEVVRVRLQCTLYRSKVVEVTCPPLS